MLELFLFLKISGLTLKLMNCIICHHTDEVHESMENNTVTLRNRDDQNQDRVPINDLGKIIQNRMDIL